MSVIFFLIGLILLFKGEFNFSNRSITRERGQTAAIHLMIPLGFDFCVYINILPTLGTNISVEAMMDALVNSNMALLQMIVLFGAIGAALYWLLSAPATTTPGARSTPAAPTKDVMTPAEAANYLRVSEPDVIALIDGGHLPA